MTRWSKLCALFGSCALLASAFANEPDPRATALIAELGFKAARTPSREMPGWQVPTRVVVGFADEERLASLRAGLPGVEVQALASGEARATQLAEARVVIASCEPALLAQAPRLHWFHAMNVGVERCTAVPGFAERGLVLTNMQRSSGRPIAEHALALLLALARGLPVHLRNQVDGQWRRDAAPAAGMREIGGRTLLVVGLGGIGTEVARRAHALGMRVIAIRNSGREGPPFVDRIGLPDELHAFAAQADAVISALPLTPKTTGLYDARFFAELKEGAWFVNVGRGASVVSRDLVAALQSGHVAGAGLDVTDPEPLPAGHPLWAMDNVIITPHVAAESDQQDERYWILVAENLRRYVAGEPLLNVVDIARGY